VQATALFFIITLNVQFDDSGNLLISNQHLSDAVFKTTIMQTQDAYNNWAQTYDKVSNPTRDLEANVIRTLLEPIYVDRLLEIGCGTGKNTQWLKDHCDQLMAVDFSEEMMQIAKEKINVANVQYLQADITKPWNFGKKDLITCSLVLEHIKDISFVFKQAANTLIPGGQFYICELHPYKQLQGSRARFEKEGIVLHLDYFIHHISDYYNAAQQNGFVCDNLQEWFDTEDRNQTPRLISYIFSKK
jgi:ubiquinone/menaquinone biosynthesis C-methylase UbiE